MGRLDGKVAIITGAAKGQGKAEAILFAKEGAKVVGTDVDFEAVEQVVAEINADNGDALAIRHDVSSKSNWTEVIDKTIKKFGKIDILINNAGITGVITQKIEDVTDETWEKIMDINAKGVFLGMREVIPYMKKNGRGSIVNISSLAGINGMGNAAYNTSKGGVRLMTKNVALDYGRDNIRVNSVHPGTIQTAMIESFIADEEGKNRMLAGIPVGFIGQPLDVAYAVLFLASDESRFITGTELIIDGGHILA